jgi:hypothetical protein
MIIKKIVKELVEAESQDVGVSPDNLSGSLEQGSVPNLNANTNLEAAKNNKQGTNPDPSNKPKGSMDDLKKTVSANVNELASCLKGTSIETEALQQINSIVKMFNDALSKKQQSGIPFVK